MIADFDVEDGDSNQAGGNQDNWDQGGLLHVGDAVTTLELPLADGGCSVLAWDPAEVDQQSWPAAASA
ncbi:MAG: hypothetical protein ACRBK7_22970 [Acidimicrobiales bacterium]